MADPDRREMVLRVARMLEREPSVVGTSAHLLAVARRSVFAQRGRWASSGTRSPSPSCRSPWRCSSRSGSRGAMV